MPPRKKRQTSRNDVADEAPQYEASRPTKRGAAKAVAGAKKVVRLGARQGGLQFVTRFPLDVLYEIFRVLHPRDLLALSRTDKSLRAVLLNKAASGVWKHSLTSTNIPALPADLSPPRYASLAFDTHCEMCARAKAGVYHWSLRLRLCRPCSNTGLIPFYRTIHEEGIDWFTIDPRFRETIITTENINYLGQMPRTEVHRLKEECRTDDIVDLDAYFEERLQRMKTIEKHAQLCVAWQERLARIRSDERTSLRDQREFCILERLRHAGWDEEIAHDRGRIVRHAVVDQPRALTERIWRNIEPVLLDIVRGIRADIAASRRKDLVRTFLRGECLLREDVKAVLPDIGDLAQFPDVNALLDTAIDTTSDQYAQLKQAALASFPAALADWRASLGIRLYDSMSNLCLSRFPPNQTDAEKMSVLNLATTIFWCLYACNCKYQSCKIFRYPYVLVHKCDPAAPGRTRDYPWRADRLGFDTRAADAAADIVRACGLDPKTATYEDMDACNVRLVCRTCIRDPVSLSVSDEAGNWWSCMLHWRNHHAYTTADGGSNIEWARLSPEAEAKVREIAPAKTKEDRTNWRCTRCEIVEAPEIFPSWASAEEHALREHGIQPGESVCGEHYIAQDAYASAPEPAAVKLLSDEFVQAKIRPIFESTDDNSAYCVKIITYGLELGLVTRDELDDELFDCLQRVRHRLQMV